MFVAIACVVEVREQLKETFSRSLSPGQVTAENLTKTCEHLLEAITDLKSILLFDRYGLASGLLYESEDERGSSRWMVFQVRKAFCICTDVFWSLVCPMRE